MTLIRLDGGPAPKTELARLLGMLDWFVIAALLCGLAYVLTVLGGCPATGHL